MNHRGQNNCSGSRSFVHKLEKRSEGLGPRHLIHGVCLILDISELFQVTLTCTHFMPCPRKLSVNMLEKAEEKQVKNVKQMFFVRFVTVTNYWFTVFFSILRPSRHKLRLRCFRPVTSSVHLHLSSTVQLCSKRKWLNSFTCIFFVLIYSCNIVVQGIKYCCTHKLVLDCLMYMVITQIYKCTTFF